MVIQEMDIAARIAFQAKRRLMAVLVANWRENARLISGTKRKRE